MPDEASAVAVSSSEPYSGATIAEEPLDAATPLLRRGVLAVLGAASLVACVLPADAVDESSASTTQDVPAFSLSSSFEPAPVEAWQLWTGSIVGLAPFVLASYEFGKRILIQQRCAVCNGSGLIVRGGLKRKCTACGGFLPWESWSRFLESSPGNGGVLRYPKGQTGVLFDVDAATAASEVVKAAADKAALEAERAAADEASEHERMKQKQ